MQFWKTQQIFEISYWDHNFQQDGLNRNVNKITNKLNVPLKGLVDLKDKVYLESYYHHERKDVLEIMVQKPYNISKMHVETNISTSRPW